MGIRKVEMERSFLDGQMVERVVRLTIAGNFPSEHEWRVLHARLRELWAKPSIFGVAHGPEDAPARRAPRAAVAPASVVSRRGPWTQGLVGVSASGSRSHTRARGALGGLEGTAALRRATRASGPAGRGGVSGGVVGRPPSTGRLMSNDLERYLHEQLTAVQVKYAYYLLAIAAAAIALALNRTVGQPLTVGHALLGLSLASWALSFYYGCEYLLEYMAVLKANAAAVSLPVAHPQSYVGAVAAGLQDVARGSAATSGRHLGRQFRLLVTGAAFYVLWHVLGMALCTPSLTDNLAKLGSCPTAEANPFTEPSR